MLSKLGQILYIQRTLTGMCICCQISGLSKQNMENVFWTWNYGNACYHTDLKKNHEVKQFLCNWQSLVHTTLTRWYSLTWLVIEWYPLALAGVAQSGLSAGLQTKGLLVQFPVRAHAWVAGQLPSGRHVRGNHTLMFLSLSFSLPSPLSENK